MSNCLIFGIVSPNNSYESILSEFLNNKQNDFDYEFNSEILFVDKYLNQFSGQFENGDNMLRKASSRDEILAIKAILEIMDILRQKKNNSKIQVFIISSIKHQSELDILKRVFGLNFFLVGLFSSGVGQLRNMADDYKMQMEKIFKKSDIFIDIDDIEVEKEMYRFLELLYGHPFHTPKKDEYFMHIAYASSTRSASFSRQVGAVIVSDKYDLISIGCNEVPKTGGGQYWPDDSAKREFQKSQVSDRSSDSNRQEIKKILDDIYEKLRQEDFLAESNSDKFLFCLKKSSLYDLIEFYREVDAEVEAISSCARNGHSTLNSIMYCTTFPCHLCIKHIISAGIKQVIYVEPYLKSKEHLFDDSILVNEKKNSENKTNDKVLFKQFIGIGPKRFLDLFSLTLSCKEIDRCSGIKKWKNSKKELRIPSHNLINFIINFGSQQELDNKESMFKTFIDEINTKIKEYSEIKRTIINTIL